ncbi:MAG: OmpA family protein [Propionibacteriaceae bacterium]|nr:OmpA family protein [Propionibacteriaceae bacterium]
MGTSKKKTIAAVVVGLLLVIGGITGGVVLASGRGSAPEPTSSTASSCLPTQDDHGPGLDLSGYEEPDGLAIVAATTANSPVPVLSPTAAGLVEALMANETMPTVFAATAEPYEIPVSLQLISGTNSASKNEVRIQNNLDRINDALQRPPNKPGMSLFEGLALAAEKLASEGSRNPWIVLIGSGLDDYGDLATTTGQLSADLDALAERVAGANPGLKLSGVTVLVQSLGYAAPPQAIATDAQRQLVTDMWVTTLGRLGATVIIDYSPATWCSVSTDQPVETTEFPSVDVGCQAETITYEFPSALLFDGDSAELREGAEELLAEPIRILLQNPSTRAEAVGHTASTATYTAEAHIRLSTERAEALGSVLRDSGVDADRITTRGVGDSEPKNEDLNPDGTQNEFAAGERRVDLLITGLSSCPVT